MPIPNYLVFGIIKDSNSNPIDGATVYAINETQGCSVTTATNSSGDYQIDISTLSSVADGDTITMACLYDHESSHSSFDLDLAFPFKRIDNTLSWLDYKNDYKIDTLISKLNLDTKYDIDTLLSSTYISDYNLDILLEKLEHSEYLLNILAKLYDVDYDFVLNLLVVLVNKNSINIDLLAKKYNIYERYKLDLLNLKHNVEVREKIDILLSILSLKEDFNLDILLKNFNVDKSYLMNILLEKTNKINFNTDTLIFKKYLTNDYIINSLLQNTIKNEFNINAPLLLEDIEIDSGIGTRIGYRLVIWSIDNCDDWDNGTFINNTICDSGDLILEHY